MLDMMANSVDTLLRVYRYVRYHFTPICNAPGESTPTARSLGMCEINVQRSGLHRQTVPERLWGQAGPALERADKVAGMAIARIFRDFSNLEVRVRNQFQSPTETPSVDDLEVGLALVIQSALQGARRHTGEFR